MKKMNKFAQVNVIALILIISIVLVLALIVWNFVLPIVQRSQNIEIGSLGINLEITKIIVGENGVIKIDVNRKSGGDSIDRLKFVFYDENGNSKTRDESKIEVLETKTYSFAFMEGLGKINRIEIFPIVGTNLGISVGGQPGDSLEVPSGVVSWWKFDSETNTFFEYYSDNGLNFNEDKLGISFWINNTHGQESLIRYSGTNNITIQNDKLIFNYGGISNESLEELNYGWNHVSLSISPEFSKIYINNYAEVFPGTPSSSEGFNLTSGSFSGNFQDIMIFNKPLSSLEVNGIYVYQRR